MGGPLVIGHFSFVVWYVMVCDVGLLVMKDGEWGMVIGGIFLTSYCTWDYFHVLY
jgi:hypothetical protein